MRAFATLTLLLVVSIPDLTFAQCPVRSAWPDAGWATRTLDSSRNDEIQALEEYAFTLQGEDSAREGVRTDAVLIIDGGELIYEEYGRGFTRENRHLAWSVTKSVAGAVAGNAVAAGFVELGDSICNYIPELPADSCSITVEDLLDMSSGLDWLEEYEDGEYNTSSVLAMLYGEGHANMAAFTATQARTSAAGSGFVYSTGDTTLLMAVVAAALPWDVRDNFPWVSIFDPIGARSPVWERDLTGTFVGGSYLYATPRDLGRFGYLFLNDGCWNGSRLLPDGWVTAASSVNQAFLNARPQWGGPEVAGRLWWLNQSLAGIQDTQPWPDVPADAYAALGHWGQSITVIPSLDLVIVRTGDDRDDTFDYNTFLKLAIDVAEGS